VRTLIFLCCDRVAVDSGVHVVETDDVDEALRAADGDAPVVILIGARASADDAGRAVAAVVARLGYFLHVREDDSPAWLQRQIRYALGRQPR
jgi:hypothetical protein